MDDEEALLQAALAISMGQSTSDTLPASTDQTMGETVVDEEDDEDEDEEEEAMRLALEMSLVSSPPPSSQEQGQGTTNVASDKEKSNNGAAPMDVDGGGGVLDAEFLNQLLGSVDADMNDPLIQAALQQLNAGNASKSDKKEDDTESKKRKHG